MTNEQIYQDYIKEKGYPTLNTEWVIEMLDMIQKANNGGVTINPRWLRATHVVWMTGTPMPTEARMSGELEQPHA